MTRTTAILISLAMALFAPRAFAQAGSVVVRPTARVVAGEPVTLGAIAKVTGGMTEYADLVVLESPPTPTEGWKPLTLDRVRRVLDAAGVDWALTTLSGVDAQIRAVSGLGEETGGLRTGTWGGSGSAGALPAGGATLRDLVVMRLQTIYGVGPDGIRIEFARVNEELLNTPVAGRVVEIEAQGASRRLPLAITVYEGESIAIRRTVRVGVEVQREVVVMTAGVERGSMIDRRDLTTEVRWVNAAEAQANTLQAIGSVARQRLDAGEIVMASDVQPPIVARRGEIVDVRCVSGSIVLKVKARAMSEARLGELIEFERYDDNHRMMARMVERGTAIARAEEQPGTATVRTQRDPTR